MDRQRKKRVVASFRSKIIQSVLDVDKFSSFLYLYGLTPSVNESSDVDSMLNQVEDAIDNNPSNFRSFVLVLKRLESCTTIADELDRKYEEESVLDDLVETDSKRPKTDGLSSNTQEDDEESTDEELSSSIPEDDEETTNDESTNDKELSTSSKDSEEKAQRNLDMRLWKAAKENQLSDMQKLLQESADVEFKHPHFGNRTALHYASRKGHEGVAKILLENDANPAAVDKDKRTALHYVASNGNEGVAKILLENGANPAAVDEDGDTPFHVAAIYGSVGVLSLLVSANKTLLQATNKNTPSKKWVSQTLGH